MDESITNGWIGGKWCNRTCECCGKKYKARYGSKTCSNKCRQKKYRMDKRVDREGCVTLTRSNKCNTSVAIDDENRIFERVR
jgi:hypothetical protein